MSIIKKTLYKNTKILAVRILFSCTFLLTLFGFQHPVEASILDNLYEIKNNTQENISNFDIPSFNLNIQDTIKNKTAEISNSSKEITYNFTQSFSKLNTEIQTDIKNQTAGFFNYSKEVTQNFTNTVYCTFSGLWGKFCEDTETPLIEENAMYQREQPVEKVFIENNEFEENKLSPIVDPIIVYRTNEINTNGLTKEVLENRLILFKEEFKNDNTVKTFSRDTSVKQLENVMDNFNEKLNSAIESGDSNFNGVSLSVSENISGHNLTLSGIFASTGFGTSTFSGNISANTINATQFIGDGSLLTGLAAGYTGVDFDSDLASSTTDDLTEGSSNLYFTDQRARNIFSSSITGIAYSTSTGELSLLGGYEIPTIASTTEWSNKQDAITIGTSLQYLRGDLSLATFPENLSAFTNDNNFISDISGFSTDDLIEGSTNLYSQWLPSGSDIYYGGGDVGIGTTVPTYKTEILSTANGYVAALALQNADGGVGDATGILFKSNSGTSNIRYKAGIFFERTGNDGIGSLQFLTDDTADTSNMTSADVRMTITSAGNVGIGTTTPSARLHTLSTTEQLRLGYDASNYLSATVDSTGGVTFNATGSNTIFNFSDIIKGTSAWSGGQISVGSSGQGGRIRFARGSDGNIQGYVGYNSETTSGEFIISSAGGAGSIGLANALGRIFFLNHQGNIGIGDIGISGTVAAKTHITSATTEQLRLGYDASNYWSNTIGSTGALVMQGVGTGGSLTLSPTAGQNVNLSLSGNGDFAVNSNQLYVDTSTGNVGIGTTTPADKLQVFGDVRLGTTGSNGCIKDYAGTGIAGTCSSDERLKTNVMDLSDGYLEKLVDLKVITYNWNQEANTLNKVDTTVTNYGLLAQNVESIFPELVTVDSNGYKQVNYSRLPLYLLKSVQELSRKVMGFADEFRTKKLCVGDTCIDESQLKILLQNQNIQSSSPTPAPISEPTTPISEPEADQPLVEVDSETSETEEAVTEETVPEVVTEPEIIPEPTPEPEVVVEPAPEPSLEPQQESDPEPEQEVAEPASEASE